MPRSWQGELYSMGGQWGGPAWRVAEDGTKAYETVTGHKDSLDKYGCTGGLGWESVNLLIGLQFHSLAECESQKQGRGGEAEWGLPATSATLEETQPGVQAPCSISRRLPTPLPPLLPLGGSVGCGGVGGPAVGRLRDTEIMTPSSARRPRKGRPRGRRQSSCRDHSQP